MKKILALVLAALMVLSLAACASNPTTPNAGDDTTVGVKEFTLRIWTPAEDQNAENNWLEKMEKAFEAAHPEYKITWVNESCSEGEAKTNVTTDVTDSADVYMFANDQMGELITAGGLSQLGGKFEEQVKADNSAFHLNTVTHTDNGIYGFPVTNNVWFTYYNKDVYTEEDVKSLDTMISKGKVVIPANDGWNAGFVFLGVGCTVFGEKGNDAAAGIAFGGDKGYLAATKMIELANLVKEGKAIQGGMDDGKLKDGSADAIFSGSWVYNGLKEALGDKLGIAKLPSFDIDGTSYPMTALGGTKCVGVNPNSGSVPGKQKVATEFAAFLASKEAQLERYTMRNVIPAHKELAADPAILANPVAVAEIETMNNNAVVQSALPQMGNYWTPVATFSQNVYAGDITMDNYKQAVDKLMGDLNKESL